jgi:hypothetical protein
MSLRASVGSTDAAKDAVARFGRTYLRGQLKAGGMIPIVVVPDDQEVAPTYLGAEGKPEENRPRLVIERGSVAESESVGD